MPEKNLNEEKKEIRSVLLTFQRSVSLEEFLKAYKNLLGQRLPSRTHGFLSDIAFLQSMPDVADVLIDSSGKVHLTGVADKSSKHIQKLVSRQRVSKPNNARGKKRQPIHKLPDTSLNVRELRPFLPGALRAEILQLMSTYNDGLTLSALALAYHRKFNKYLSLVQGLDTLEGMIKLMPELEVKNENGERVVYSRNSVSSAMKNGANHKEKIESSPSQVRDNRKELMLQNSLTIHQSGISDDILQDFQKLLKKCSDGIVDIHFPPLYENVTGKSFDLHELGYTSLIEMVDALPHIFKRIPNPNNTRQWLVLPAKKPIRHSPKDGNLSSSSHSSCHQPQERIPADASSPALQYIQSRLPENVNLNEYLPAFVSAIVSPGLFWFQLQIDEYLENFQKLEEEMGHFYDNYAHRYKMNNADLAIGATCVVQCPDDHQWYRAVVKSIPNSKFVNVSFVDYGSRSNVVRDSVYYVKSKYHDYPACAFKAQLAGLKPPENASSWNKESQKRFIELCNCVVLMAYIKPLDKDSFSVYLCDTGGDTDRYLNDILVAEGYAELDNEYIFETEVNSDTCRTTINPESKFSLSMDQNALRSDDSRIHSESNVLSPVSYSPQQLNNDEKPSRNAYKNVQGSKRYIKSLEIWKGDKIYIINLENRLFMSCGELCKLLWEETNSDVLLERLMYREVTIPFLNLRKEDHAELFKECAWYRIPGFEESDSDISTLILCPLEEVFNVLNIFGHPSVILRKTIRDELREFDPLDPVWKESPYAESRDWEYIDKDTLEKLNKLCLYDLKAKSEALKIRRLKLLRDNSASCSEELKQVHNLQNIIEKRIKHIDAICIQYACCS